MSKAILVMDMPKNCDGCGLTVQCGSRWICGKTKMRVSINPSLDGVPVECPLVEAIGYIQPVGHMVSWEDEE